MDRSVSAGKTSFGSWYHMFTLGDDSLSVFDLYSESIWSLYYHRCCMIAKSDAAS